MMGKHAPEPSLMRSNFHATIPVNPPRRVDRYACHKTLNFIRKIHTAKQDLIATENLEFPSKSSKNQNDSHLMIAI